MIHWTRLEYSVTALEDSFSIIIIIIDYHYEGRSEQVAEWIVQQVDAGRSVQIGVSQKLTGKQGFCGATA